MIYKLLITFKVPTVKDLPSKKALPSNWELDSEDDIAVEVQFPMNRPIQVFFLKGMSVFLIR